MACYKKLNVQGFIVVSYKPPYEVCCHPESPDVLGRMSHSPVLYFSGCVCSQSMDSVILSFTIAFGTTASVGFGFYLSYYLRHTCSFLKKAASFGMTRE